MPKRRDKYIVKEEQEKKIENFVNNVDENIDILTLDKNAKRDFKAIRLPFNQWEYETLETASKKTNRSKTSFIRNAIMEAAEKYK